MTLLGTSIVVVRLVLIVQVPGIFDGDRIPLLWRVGAIAFLEYLLGDTHDGGQRSKLGWCYQTVWRKRGY